MKPGQMPQINYSKSASVRHAMQESKIDSTIDSFDCREITKMDDMEDKKDDAWIYKSDKLMLMGEKDEFDDCHKDIKPETHTAGKEDIDGELEAKKEEIEFDTKKEEIENSEVVDEGAMKEGKKNPRFLPYWVTYIAWTMIVLVMILSPFFTILYSFEWGGDKSRSWMTAFFLSFFEAEAIVDPVKVSFIHIIHKVKRSTLCSVK